MIKKDNRKKQIKREINLLQGRFEQFKKRQRLLEQSKREISILHDRIEQFKKRKRLLEKRLKKIAKMQNLSQNELNQVARIHYQSRGEPELIAKMRRIKNYKEMLKEELIISLLKSKPSIAEFVNNNLDDDKISDIKRILNQLRDILPKKYRKKIKKTFYEIENKENLSELEKEENDEYLRKLVRILETNRDIVTMIVIILITME